MTTAIRRVRATCAPCGAHADLTISGDAMPAESAQAFADLGWRVTDQSCRCPACAGRHPAKESLMVPGPSAGAALPPRFDRHAAVRHAADRHAAVRALLSDPATAALTDGRIATQAGVSDTFVLRERRAMGLPSSRVLAAQSPRPPEQQSKPTADSLLERASPADRRRMKDALDACFDDAEGRYLDGKTDESVARSLDLPRALVTRFRDLVYGPIQVNPEVEQFKADIAAHAAALPAIQNQLAKLLDTVAAVQTATAALQERASKLGVR